MTDCAHCWHGTGTVLESYPPQHPEVCCHCGEKRIRREVLPVDSSHGPYAPAPAPRGMRWETAPLSGTRFLIGAPEVQVGIPNVLSEALEQFCRAVPVFAQASEDMRVVAEKLKEAP